MESPDDLTPAAPASPPSSSATVLEPQVRRYFQESKSVTAAPHLVGDSDDDPAATQAHVLAILRDPLLFTTELLDLTGLHLASLPTEINNFPFLQNLDLHDNSLQAGVAGLLVGLLSLRSVTLSRNGMAEFPWQLKTLPNLETLGLASNLITALPEFAPGDFPALQILRLGNNQLTTVPGSLENLGNLRHLFLFRNSLGAIPESLATLPKLTHLDVQNNPGLLQIPVPILERSRKRTLELSTSLPDELLPGMLFLGDWEAAHNKQALQGLGIGHILSICDRTPAIDVSVFDHLHLNLEDASTVALSSNFDRCFEFIARHQTSGKAVLVHCMVGASRSATVCIAFIMKARKLKLQESLAYVRNIRPIVSPNPGFMAQLATFENTLAL